MPPIKVNKRRFNGAAARAIREALGVPQGRMAERVGVSWGYLSNCEAGKKQPSDDVIRRWATQLGVEVDAVTDAPVEAAA